MQTFESQYGREPISVSDPCPTIAISYRLDRTHVGTSFDAVESMIREAIASNRATGVEAGWSSDMEEEAVRFALWRHEENRAAYSWVMGPH